jgi:GT2 family glycosyltransferase
MSQRATAQWAFEEPSNEVRRSGVNLALERVAVIVVLYKSRSLIADLVASLETGMAGVQFELIAVDNDSPDDSVAVMREVAPRATIVRTGRNGGYAAGINAGVAAAGQHTAILVLNSDVRLGAGCAAALLEGVRQPGIGITVPRLVDADDRVIDSMRREPTVARAFCDAIFGAQRAGGFASAGEVVSDRREYCREQRTDWAEGSTQLITAECWRATGPWDESFFLYSEETEYDLRARDLGFATLYVPTAHAIHLIGGSGISNDLWKMQVVNRIKLFRRRHGRCATALFWLATLLRETTRAVLGRSNSRAAARTLLGPKGLAAVLRPTWPT